MPEWQIKALPQPAQPLVRAICALQRAQTECAQVPQHVFINSPLVGESSSAALYALLLPLYIAVEPWLIEGLFQQLTGMSKAELAGK